MSDARTPCGMIALQPARLTRHPFRLRLLGTLPRELHDPALWHTAAFFLPHAFAAIGIAFIGMAVLP